MSTTTNVTSNFQIVLTNNSNGDTVNDTNHNLDLIVTGNGSDDTVRVTDSNGDVITVGNGTGDDTTVTDSRGDVIVMGNGADDDLTLSASSSNIIAMGNGAGDIVTLNNNSNSNIVAIGNGNDTLIATNSNNNLIVAGNGNDTVKLGTGNNGFVLLGNGADTIDAGAGSDTVTTGKGLSAFTYEAAQNAANSAAAGVSFYDAGNSADTLTINMNLTQYMNYESEDASHVANLKGGIYDFRSINLDIQGFIGTDITINHPALQALPTGFSGTVVAPVSDTGLTMTAGQVTFTADTTPSDVVTIDASQTAYAVAITDSGTGTMTEKGGAGNDTLTAGAGTDTLIAGSGTTTLNAGSGNDTLIGGAGNDTFNASLDAASTVIETGTGNSQINLATSAADFTVVNGVDVPDAITVTNWTSTGIGFELVPGDATAIQYGLIANLISIEIIASIAATQLNLSHLTSKLTIHLDPTVTADISSPLDSITLSSNVTNYSGASADTTFIYSASTDSGQAYTLAGVAGFANLLQLEGDSNAASYAFNIAEDPTTAGLFDFSINGGVTSYYSAIPLIAFDGNGAPSTLNVGQVVGGDTLSNIGSSPAELNYANDPNSVTVVYDAAAGLGAVYDVSSTVTDNIANFASISGSEFGNDYFYMQSVSGSDSFSGGGVGIPNNGSTGGLLLGGGAPAGSSSFNTIDYSAVQGPLTFDIYSATNTGTVTENALTDQFSNFQEVNGSQNGGDTFNLDGVVGNNVYQGGGSGNDTLSYANDLSENSLTIDLTQGLISQGTLTDGFTNFDNFIGSNSSDDTFIVAARGLNSSFTGGDYNPISILSAPSPQNGPNELVIDANENSDNITLGNGLLTMITYVPELTGGSPVGSPVGGGGSSGPTPAPISSGQIESITTDTYDNIQSFDIVTNAYTIVTGGGISDTYTATAANLLPNQQATINNFTIGSDIIDLTQVVPIVDAAHVSFNQSGNNTLVEVSPTADGVFATVDVLANISVSELIAGVTEGLSITDLSQANQNPQSILGLFH